MYSSVGYTVGLTKFQLVQCTVVLPAYNSQTLGKSWDLTNTNGDVTRSNYAKCRTKQYGAIWGFNVDLIGIPNVLINFLPAPGIDARPSSTTKQFAATVFWGPAYLQIAFGHNLSITKDSWFSQSVHLRIHTI